jgi:lipid-A-disaccharide synthase-like uncharacterized protein
VNEELLWLEWTGLHVTWWKLIGYTGALMFGARWVVQFIASKRAGKPVIPRLFWYMSVVGSLMTLSYFLFSAKQDSVGVLQNLFPSFTAYTALYSLYLDIKHRAAGTGTRGAWSHWRTATTWLPVPAGTTAPSKTLALPPGAAMTAAGSVW